jgi:hypothetical protein
MEASITMAEQLAPNRRSFPATGTIISDSGDMEAV